MKKLLNTLKHNFTFHNSQFTIILPMTIYQEKASALERRTVVFSVQLIKQLGVYSGDKVLKSLISQVVRSATSIGANYAEANNASSKQDFKNKIYISKKEAAETRYWLTVLQELLPTEDLSKLRQEALELTLIFQKIVSSLKMANAK